MSWAWGRPSPFPTPADRAKASIMKAALAALALALSATVAMAQDAETPAQQRARDYFKPGGQYEKDNLGIRERLHDAEIDAEPRRGCGGGRGANFFPGGR